MFWVAAWAEAVAVASAQFAVGVVASVEVEAGAVVSVQFAVGVAAEVGVAGAAAAQSFVAAAVPVFLPD